MPRNTRATVPRTFAAPGVLWGSATASMVTCTCSSASTAARAYTHPAIMRERLRQRAVAGQVGLPVILWLALVFSGKSSTPRTSFVMSSADPLGRPRVRRLALSRFPEHPQTCALEHSRSGGRRRKWLVERSIAQHGDEDAEQAIADAAPHAHLDAGRGGVLESRGAAESPGNVDGSQGRISHPLMSRSSNATHGLRAQGQQSRRASRRVLRSKSCATAADKGHGSVNLQPTTMLTFTGTGVVSRRARRLLPLIGCQPCFISASRLCINSTVPLCRSERDSASRKLASRKPSLSPASTRLPSTVTPISPCSFCRASRASVN